MSDEGPPARPRSLTRQLEDEARRVAAGGVVSFCKRRKNDLVAAEAQLEAVSPAEDDADAGNDDDVVLYELTDGDDPRRGVSAGLLRPQLSWFSYTPTRFFCASSAQEG